MRVEGGTQRKRSGLNVLLTSLLVIAVAGSSYAAGVYFGAFDGQHEQTELIERVLQLEEQLLATQQDMAVYKMDADIAERAQENLRLELREYREQIVELEKASRFYQNVLGAGQTPGLVLERFIVNPLEEEGMYSFQLMLAQHSDEHAQISGAVSLVVVGEQNGEKIELDQDEVLFDETASLAFSFSYFQELKGRLALPENFAPQSIRVIAKRAGTQAGSVTQFFKWEPSE